MHKRVPLVSLALVLLMIAGCDMIQKKEKEEPAAEKPAVATEVEVVIPVQCELPKRGDISAHFETTTRVEAETRVQVVAEAVGECTDVKVNEGDMVQAGQVLAELDKKQMMATIGQTEVQVRQQETTYQRAKGMFSEGLSSAAECDNAKFAYDQAIATLNMQKVQLEKLTVRSPINGLVTHKLIQTGQMVSGGAPIFSIVDPNSFMLVINPPERELARLQQGQKAKVTIDALGTEEFDATVRRINPNVDATSGTVKVTLDFDAQTRQKLRDAAFARVRLVMDTHANALLVAKDAIIEENARKYVFVVKQESPEQTQASEVKAIEVSAKPADGGEGEAVQEPEKPADDKPAFVAERLEVKTGFEDSNFTEVVTGAEDTSLIVILGQHTLKSGSRVTVTNANDEIMSRAGLSAEAALAAAKDRKDQAAADAESDMPRRPRK